MNYKWKVEEQIKNYGYFINVLPDTWTWSNCINKDNNQNVILNAMLAAELYVEHNICIAFKNIENNNVLFINIYTNKSKKKIIGRWDGQFNTSSWPGHGVLWYSVKHYSGYFSEDVFGWQ